MTQVVNSIQVSVISHATEDVAKVLGTLARILPPDSLRLRAEKRTVKGHFGNPITTILSTAHGKQAGRLLDELYDMLRPQDQTKLLAELESRIDEDGRLHLRFDKQDCFRGSLRLEDEDPIKIIVSLNGPSVNSQTAVRFFKDRLETSDHASTYEGSTGY